MTTGINVMKMPSTQNIVLIVVYHVITSSYFEGTAGVCSDSLRATGAH